MTLQTLLQLSRVQNVFTAMANVLAGILLARGGTLHGADLRLIVASALFYMGGMVLGDVFDWEIDAIERPERPIPSGRASFGGAVVLGLFQLGMALWLVWPLGASPRLVAIILVATIVLYDGVFKDALLGPVAMGACLFLHVCLGFAVAPWPEPWMWVAPTAIGMYTAVLSYLARDDVDGLIRDRARNAVHMMMVLFAVFVAFLTLLTPATTFSGFALAGPFLVLLAMRGTVLFRPLERDASPPTLGRAIGGGMLLMPVIDASVVATAGYFEWAWVVAGLSVPASLLRRWT